MRPWLVSESVRGMDAMGWKERWEQAREGAGKSAERGADQVEGERHSVRAGILLVAKDEASVC